MRPVDATFEITRLQRSLCRIAGCLVLTPFIHTGTNTGMAQSSELHPVYWVGYQNDCMVGFPDIASFWHGDNWYNFTIPGVSEVARFGAGFDPGHPGYPTHIHLGSFCIDFGTCPEPSIIDPPAWGWAIGGVEFVSGEWLLDFASGSFACNQESKCGPNLGVEEFVLGDPSALLPNVVHVTITARSEDCANRSAFISTPRFVVGAYANDTAEVHIHGNFACVIDTITIGSAAGSDGTLRLSSEALIWSEVGSIIVPRGAFEVTTGAQVVGYGLIVAGAQDGATGRITITGTGSLMEGWTYLVGEQGNGVLEVLDGGIAAATSGWGGFTIGQRGLVKGDGLIDATYNSLTVYGKISPGALLGELRVLGDYYQYHPGRLEIQIEPGENDRLAIEGRASLGGVLQIQRAPGFSPPVGSTFQIIEYDSHSGRFDASEGMYLGNGRTLQAVYKSDGVDLVVRKLGDFDGDGVIGISDHVHLTAVMLGPLIRSVAPDDTPGDFSLDGRIDLFDYAEMQNTTEGN